MFTFPFESFMPPTGFKFIILNGFKLAASRLVTWLLSKHKYSFEFILSPNELIMGI